MKVIVKKLLYIFLRLFYSEDVLRGKWFTKYQVGYLWALHSIPHRLRHRSIKVPYAKSAKIFSGHNLIISSSSINCLQSDIYLQNRLNKVIIGDNCYIAPHVGIITEQHDIHNLEKHAVGSDVMIGNWCWVGMNSVIMPGVVLGDHTTVGANSVVTKSFPEGYVVLAGSPAKIIRKLDKHEFEEENT